MDIDIGRVVPRCNGEGAAVPLVRQQGHRKSTSILSVAFRFCLENAPASTTKVKLPANRFSVQPHKIIKGILNGIKYTLHLSKALQKGPLSDYFHAFSLMSSKNVTPSHCPAAAS